jgi:hypothetical protein
MSELSDIKDSIHEIKTIMTGHISETKAYREEKDKVISALTSTVWNKDGKPGLETQVDRLVQKEQARTWIVRTLCAAIAGLGLERFWNLLKH